MATQDSTLICECPDDSSDSASKATSAAAEFQLYRCRPAVARRLRAVTRLLCDHPSLSGLLFGGAVCAVAARAPPRARLRAMECAATAALG